MVFTYVSNTTILHVVCVIRTSPACYSIQPAGPERKEEEEENKEARKQEKVESCKCTLEDCPAAPLFAVLKTQAVITTNYILLSPSTCSNPLPIEVQAIELRTASSSSCTYLTASLAIFRDRR